MERSRHLSVNDLVNEDWHSDHGMNDHGPTDLTSLRDLAAPPVFPGTPTLSEWTGLLIGLLLIATIAFFIVHRLRMRGSRGEPLRAAFIHFQTQRERILAGDPRSGAELLGKELRRILGTLTSPVYLSASGQELTRLIAATSDREGHGLAEILKQVDSASYSPSWDRSQLQTLCARTGEELERWIELESTTRRER